MKTIFDYVLGNGGSAGIAIIGGDAGGFSYIDEPMDSDEIFNVIEVMLKEEDFDDQEKAELMSDLSLQIEKIHAVHVERFASYKINRQ